MSVESPRVGREDAGDERIARFRDSHSVDVTAADLTNAEAIDAGDSDLAETNHALLRRAFGPDAGELDPREVQALADLVHRRAANTEGRRVVPRSHAAARTAFRAGSRSVSAPAETPVPVDTEILRPLTRRDLWRRLRAAGVGAAVAVVVVGISVSLWTVGQPRPAVVLHGQPVPAGEIERTLEAEPSFFRSYRIEEAVSYGEAYGVRVLGAALSSTTYEEEMECLWLLDPENYTIPLCLGTLGRPDFPWLIDIWYDGEAFTWEPPPRADLLQVRISVQGDRLEMWEEVIDRTS